MDEAGSYYSQRTNTRAENQTLHVLTNKWELNNENTWTQRGEHHTLEPFEAGGSWGGIAWGEMPDVGEGEEGSKSPWHILPM